MKIAIYGGSFDPPHLGHYNIVLKALKKLEIDKLIILPNFKNPWKNSTKFSPQKRLELLEILFSKFPKVEISSLEIDNGYPTKTIESIRYFSKTYLKIYFIIGADNLEKLDKWDNFNELEKLLTFVIATRGDIVIPNRYIKLEVDFPISSTELRENLDFSKIPKEIRDQLI